MPTITVNVNQVATTASDATIRTHIIPIDRPEAKGGTDHGPMGGELLLASIGGCFMSNLLEAIRSRAADITHVQTEVAGTLEGTPARFTAVALTISADHNDRDQLQKLVTISERSCIAANSVRDGLDLTVQLAD